MGFRVDDAAVRGEASKEGCERCLRSDVVMHICLKSFCLFHIYLPFTDEFPTQDILNDFNLPALLFGKYISLYWHLFGLILSLALIALHSPVHLEYL